MAGGEHRRRVEVFDGGGASVGDCLVLFTVGEEVVPEPEPVLDPVVQAALNAMQEQIDTNLGRLTVLESAHDALVVDIDGKLGTPVTVWRA